MKSDKSLQEEDTRNPASFPSWLKWLLISGAVFGGLLILVGGAAVMLIWKLLVAVFAGGVCNPRC